MSAVSPREDELLAVIADSYATREGVARAYGRLIYAEPRLDADWHKINVLIEHRWSMTTLRWIKTRAWKLQEEIASDSRPLPGEAVSPTPRADG